MKPKTVVITGCTRGLGRAMIPVFVEAGRATFQSTCASCHHAALTGGIGPNLVDSTWIHGGTPINLLKVVNDGVAAKGMPTWGPVLGGKKVSEVVAFVLSHHTPPAAP